MFGRSTVAYACVSVLAAVVLLAACAPSLTAGPSAEVPSPTEERATEVPAPTEPPEATPEPTATPVPTGLAGPTAAEYASDADKFLMDFADAGLFSGAVLVARGGDILLSKGYGIADREDGAPNVPQTRFRVSGVQGQFNAMGILILQAQGRLDLQDPICTYLPECPAAWELITIHHLLSNASGLPDHLYGRGLRIPRWGAKRPAATLPAEGVISHISDEPLRYQPGDGIDYYPSASEDFVIAEIIEQASGTPYDQFLRKHIFAPLGMQDTGPGDAGGNLALGYNSGSSHLAPVDDMSAVRGVASHYSTVEDMLRWDQSLYTEQLVPQTLLDQMFANHGSFTGEGADGARALGRIGAGYGWQVGEQFGHRDLLAWGGAPGFWDLIDRYPEDRVTIIVLSNQTKASVFAVATALAKILFAAD